MFSQVQLLWETGLQFWILDSLQETSTRSRGSLRKGEVILAGWRSPAMDEVFLAGTLGCGWFELGRETARIRRGVD